MGDEKKARAIATVLEGLVVCEEERVAWKINLRSYLRIMLLDTFCLRMLFVPLAVTRGTSQRRVNGCSVYWDYRQVHVFGVRIARWVLEAPRVYEDKKEGEDPQGKATKAVGEILGAWQTVHDEDESSSWCLSEADLKGK